MGLIVFNPTGGPAAQEVPLAQRRDTLENGVLGVIDNGKRNSDRVLNRVVKGIKAEYTLKDVVTVKKDSASHAIHTDLSRELAEKCDFVIAGIGD